ncbi:MAG: glycosyltransferase family 61 protein [Haloechinothrix sp.]
MVEDLTRAWGRAFEDHPVWTAAATPAYDIPGVAAVIAARGAATNFSHFLADTLPRIQLIRDSGTDVDTWIVSSVDHTWQRDGLDRAGIPVSRVIALTETPWISARTLLVPSRTGFAPLTAPWARDRLTRLLELEPRRRHRKLLLSRSQATRRRLLNEDQLFEALAPCGYERVHFDGMPLIDQLRLIHESTDIVATHGSALGHLLHAPRGGHVVEIVNPSIVPPDARGLAAVAGWTHTLIPATPTPGLDDTEVVNQDLHVDVDALVGCLTGKHC